MRGALRLPRAAAWSRPLLQGAPLPRHLAGLGQQLWPTSSWSPELQDAAFGRGRGLSGPCPRHSGPCGATPLTLHPTCLPVLGVAPAAARVRGAPTPSPSVAPGGSLGSCGVLCSLVGEKLAGQGESGP